MTIDMPRINGQPDAAARALSHASFDDLQSLLESGGTLSRLVERYQAVFGEPDVWAETWSADDVIAKLKDEMSGAASMRVCLEGDDVIGFCWAQLIEPEAVALAVESIKFYRGIALPDLRERLARLMNGEPAIYVHDLGIAREARGRIALSQLIYPVLSRVAERCGSGRVLFWTMPDTLVSTFARRAHFTEHTMPNGMQFHVGEFRNNPPGNVISLRWLQSKPGTARGASAAPAPRALAA